MRKHLTVIFLVSSFMLPAVGHAQSGLYSPNRAEVFFGDVYLGVKYGRLTYAESVPDYDDGADIRNLGFSFGRKFNDNVAMEFSYDYTVTDDSSSAGDVSTDVLGFFVVGKTTGDVYFKGRLGYTRLTQERDTSGESIDAHSYGIAVGGAIGFTVYDRGSLEIEYTILPTTDNTRFIGADEKIEADFLSVNYVWGFN